ncbi:Uncharacterised protein [Mycoplasmopsis synoviae]|uniref:Uncharacterized protein n=1 Tax=Mycoplasmopsis synoviae TaxID=2109 RepID=A0A3B0P6Y9_MYCSY|nr:Uncharacterised protein [Mycoplasmopsis synoviae]
MYKSKLYFSASFFQTITSFTSKLAFPIMFILANLLVQKLELSISLKFSSNILSLLVNATILHSG